MENVIIMSLLIVLEIVFQESSFKTILKFLVQNIQNPSGYILELQYYICSSDGPVCAFLVCYSFKKIEV